MPVIDVRLKSGGQAGTEWLIVPELTPGAIGPKPPFSKLPVAGFGAIESAQILTMAPGDSSPTSATTMSSIFAKSSIQSADIVNGAGFVLVAVGGYPGAAPGPWWHALTYALVRGDP
jgi:hypothetical protein